MSAHTPGPWTASGGAVFSETAVHLAGRYLVASVYGDDPECREDAAMIDNARLISAAPDLLEALKRCRFDSLNMTLADMKFIRAAIAKAEGAQS
jgi:hypothetical protein